MMNCATQTGFSSAERGRRHASSACSSGSASVCMKSLLNAGCARSAAWGARLNSAALINSSLRVRKPWLVSVTRRISTSSSGDTVTST